MKAENAESKRAAAIMDQRQTNERIAVRVPLHVAAKIDCPEIGYEDRSALIRDVSPHGVFFFAQFIPALGEEIALSFSSASNGGSPRVNCRGHVIRVERFSSGAAGIAVKLDDYQLVENATAS